LQSIYGHPGKLKNIYMKAKKEIQSFPVNFNFDLEIDSIKREQSKISTIIQESDIFCELIDLTKLMQFFVKNSHLHFSVENLEKVKGIFNPCINEKKSDLFIK
jgi:hypothetical protein